MFDGNLPCDDGENCGAQLRFTSASRRKNVRMSHQLSRHYAEEAVRRTSAATSCEDRKPRPNSPLWRFQYGAEFHCIPLAGPTKTRQQDWHLLHFGLLVTRCHSQWRERDLLPTVANPIQLIPKFTLRASQ
jgi:hypothetical protein